MKQTQLLSFFVKKKDEGNSSSSSVTCNTSNDVKIALSADAIDTIAIPTVAANTSLSSYERLREENIRRNQDFLAAIGIAGGGYTISVQPQREVTNATKSNVYRKKMKLLDNRISDTFAVPTRHSSRLAMSACTYAPRDTIAETTQDKIKEDYVEDKDLTYDDSSVLRYVIDALDDSNIADDDDDDTSNDYSGAICSSMAPNHLIPKKEILLENLSAVYSMQYHPLYKSILLTAGKNGIVEVVSVGDKKKGGGDDVLMSFKAHKRWISTAKFIATSTSCGNKLNVVTASDDSTIKIWDISSTAISATLSYAKPKQQQTANNIHEKGIFSLDYSPNSNALLTGSKDKSVALSRIRSDSFIEVVSRYDDLHTGVVKCVSWSLDNNVFASASQDSSVCIMDTRTKDVAARISHAHCGGVHTCAWLGGGTLDSAMVVTAGVDSIIKIFDIRTFSSISDNITTPLFNLHGHHGPNVKKAKMILQPRVMGRFIIAAGEGSALLSIYDGFTGKAISRGDIRTQPASIATDEVSGSVAISCQSSNCILHLKSQFM